jgi:outer membrane protein
MKIRLVFLLMGVLVLNNLGLSASAGADSSQLGNATVDLRKVFDGFYKTKLLQTKIQQIVKPFEQKHNDMKANLKTEMINYSNLLASARDPSLTTDERDRLKQAATYKLSEIAPTKADISKFEEDAGLKVIAMRDKMREDILEEIFTVINSRDKSHRYTFDQFYALAKEHKTLISIDTGEKLSGDTIDLTGSILAQLNAGAPAGTF